MKRVLTKAQALELLRLKGYTITDNMAATVLFPSTYSFFWAAWGWLVCHTLFSGYPLLLYTSILSLLYLCGIVKSLLLEPIEKAESPMSLPLLGLFVPDL